MKRTPCLSPFPIIFKKKGRFLWVLVSRHFLSILAPLITSNKPKTNPNKKSFWHRQKKQNISHRNSEILDKWKNRSLLCNFRTAYECHKIRIDSPHCSNIPRLNQGIFLSFLKFIPFPYKTTVHMCFPFTVHT